jgi:hypothetical protein
MAKNYDDKMSELSAAGAVLRTGMPQSTPHERRAMRAHHNSLMQDVASMKRSRVFVSAKPAKKKSRKKS